MAMELVSVSKPALLDPTWITALHSSSEETQAQNVFKALMWALSYPGRCYPLPPYRMRPGLTPLQQSCLLIGEALLDLETSFFTPDGILSQALARTSARWATGETAAYHFYPDLYYLFPELAPLDSPMTNLASARNASSRTLFYPDRSATLVIACELGHGTPLRLSGPGVPGQTKLVVAGIPEAFWSLRAATMRYPLGWDIFLVDHDQLVGLPRTTKITYIKN